MRRNRYFHSTVVSGRKGECHAHQVLQRFQEELIELQEQREQIQLEQERILQEEVSPAEAA